MRTFALLDTLRRDECRRLIEASRHVFHRAGDVLFERGEPALHVHLILDGDIRLTAIPRGEIEPVTLRDASRGDAVGLEAAFGARARHARATVHRDAETLEFPAELFARAIRRSTNDATNRPALEALERAVRRRLTDEELRTLAFTSALPDSERAILLDMVRRRRVEPGASIYRVGQRAEAAFFITRGLVRLGTRERDTMHVRAYLSEGDIFGEHEALAGRARVLAAEAVNAVEVLVLSREHLRTLTSRSPGLLESIQRISWGRVHVQQDVFEQAADGDPAALDRTRHLFEDVHRASLATELLAIDLGRCVNCGTCAWSCHQTHGQSRLVRRGEKVRAPGGSLSLEDGRQLLLPNSCQHCTDPACMVDCPTGAIGRDPSGEVFINPDTCIGCEACAKACPWDNIHVAPTAPGSPFDQVAIKCDLCRDYEGVSACVANCPTGAISRIDPSRESDALRSILGLGDTSAGPSGAPRSGRLSPTWRWSFGAVALLGSIAGVFADASPFAGIGLFAGVTAAFAVLGLVAYGLRKRLIRRWMTRHRGTGKRPGARLSTWYVGHLVLGGLLVVAASVHTGGDLGGGLSAALFVSLAVSITLGTGGAVLYTTLPRRVAALVDQPRLDEDLEAEARRLRNALSDVLSGREDAKTRAAGHILPALDGRAAPWRALLSRDDRHTIRARMLAAATRGDVDAATRHALDRASRHATAHLGLRAERIAHRLLAGWLAPHLVAGAIALVLLVAHAISAMQLLGWGS